MKNYDNAITQKINTIADWVLRIVAINFMMILTALPIITIYPSLLAGFKMFKDAINKKEAPLVKGYFKYFVENFVDKMQMGLLLAFILILGVINLTVYKDYLEVSVSPMNILGYYAMILMVVTGLFITMYTLPLMSVYPKTKIWLLIKFAFFLSGKYFVRTFIAILIVLVPFAMLLTPITALLFLFIGISTPVLLYALLFNKVSEFIESLGKENV